MTEGIVGVQLTCSLIGWKFFPYDYDYACANHAPTEHSRRRTKGFDIPMLVLICFCQSQLYSLAHLLNCSFSMISRIDLVWIQNIPAGRINVRSWDYGGKIVGGNSVFEPVVPCDSAYHWRSVTEGHTFSKSPYFVHSKPQRGTQRDRFRFLRKTNTALLVGRV